jgi:hypothetical protein
MDECDPATPSSYAGILIDEAHASCPQPCYLRFQVLYLNAYVVQSFSSLSDESGYW